MKKLACVITAAAAMGVVAATPVAAHTTAAHTTAAHTTATHNTAGAQRCTPVRPAADFYAGGRIASAPIVDRNAKCTTISVSGIRDVSRPWDRCQTFLVALLSTDGRDPTYTEPVRACSPTHRTRTVLATGVPTGTQFRVLYQIDYIDPAPQTVRYTVWR
ncbi:hypothetical protein [Paractinoplanes hotanensis]|uniref:Secreted protein n=1 Tax=Paractinoplanes hotanensis TaxID=2906497 RepID=A0ABT0Y9S1_9ACTN|nr:hypothetical protein [Actinoplanes hotanensis]MCM4082779.1 hypothetical protein [Actinoplanes hotanensis]